MDTRQFDHLVRAFSRHLSRRGLAGILGITALGRAELVDARNRKRKKRKKRKNQGGNNPLPPVNQSPPPPPRVVLNQFNCVNVGNFCLSGGDCCSGICQGSSCQAHDASTCLAGQIDNSCVGANDNIECQASNGNDGGCGTTTGNAGFCIGDRKCFACTKDADCQAGNVCGADAACIVCAKCAATGGTACAGPVPESCP